MAIVIGTSGWQYASWRGRFYPPEVAQAGWLEHYAERFAVVEVNNTFYRLPKESTFADWARRTPDDFVFVCKMSRFFTHLKRLRDPEQPVGLFLERAAPMGEKLGPVLVQLPPTMKADVQRLDAALAAFPPSVRVAVEFRHDSWFTDDIRGVLERRGAALCLADRGSRPVTPLWATAPWTYLRFHWGRGRPESCYGVDALDHWVERLAQLLGPDPEAFVFFNNDPNGCAVRDAARFGDLAARAGITTTRVATIREAPVGG